VRKLGKESVCEIVRISDVNNDKFISKVYFVNNNDSFEKKLMNVACFEGIKVLRNYGECSIGNKSLFHSIVKEEVKDPMGLTVPFASSAIKLAILRICVETFRRFRAEDLTIRHRTIQITMTRPKFRS